MASDVGAIFKRKEPPMKLRVFLLLMLVGLTGAGIVLAAHSSGSQPGVLPLVGLVSLLGLGVIFRPSRLTAALPVAKDVAVSTSNAE